jgi:hypothetical protein
MSSPLTDAERRELASIAAAMIPADKALGMPAADDPAILADIERSIGRDLTAVRQTLADIATAAGATFATLAVDRREALVTERLAAGGWPAWLFGRLVLGAYYRDDRVLRALGHEARAPFPKGYALEQGDWSLLDPVRDRAPLWRDDRKGAR